MHGFPGDDGGPKHVLVLAEDDDQEGLLEHTGLAVDDLGVGVPVRGGELVLDVGRLVEGNAVTALAGLMFACCVFVPGVLNLYGPFLLLPLGIPVLGPFFLLNLHNFVLGPFLLFNLHDHVIGLLLLLTLHGLLLLVQGVLPVDLPPPVLVQGGILAASLCLLLLFLGLLLLLPGVLQVDPLPPELVQVRLHRHARSP